MKLLLKGIERYWRICDKMSAKDYLLIIISILLLTDLAILLNIPFLRQIFGFLFLTLLPGLLILQILKLNKIGFLEKFILFWGLSISFLMFFGLSINNLSLSLGYEHPLSTISLLISFNMAFIVLAIIGYKTKTFEKSFIKNWLPHFNLSTSEKAFLVVPILFPALSIFGMHVMNTADNNIILMILLFLIPAYVIFVCFFNHKFPKRMYPVVIFLISISLLFLMALRSNHIIGMDAHLEYYFFQTTLSNLHWSVFGHSTLDACLSISLLPTIYQLFLNISPEFLFKILYPSLYSISPLVIYIISKKYVEERYAFLASCFFIFQQSFLLTTMNARTNTAILFFALAMMTLFNDKIGPLKKRILFIVFMASCMVSHYSTTYIFFFIILGAFVGIEALSRKYTFKKVVSLSLVILFFSMIFFWYSQVTEAAFNAGVGFVENTLISLNRFFIEESRAGATQAMLGEGIMQKGIPHKIEFVFTWLTFALIGIGIITLLVKRKEMLFPESNFKKPDFLKEKFEVSYFVIALACSGLLVAIVALPFISKGYGIQRLYATAITILSMLFVIGGILLAKHFFFFTKRKPVLKEKQKSLTKNLSLKKKTLPKKQKEEGKENAEVRAYLIILLVLIPYFLCVTGVMYNIFGVPNAIILNSEGKQYDMLYVHDQEIDCVKWLGKLYAEQKNPRIYAAAYGGKGLTSQGIISNVDRSSLSERKKINGYIYLGYYNIINGKLVDSSTDMVYNMTEYSDIFVGKSRIYDNGGSEIWK